MKLDIRILSITAVLLIIQVSSQSNELGDVTATPLERTDDQSQIIDRSYAHYHHPDPTLKGFWKKKLIWKPRWLKTWQPKKIYVAVWKKMWGPAFVNEWVPIPKAPPGWVKPHHYYGRAYVKKLISHHH